MKTKEYLNSIVKPLDDSITLYRANLVFDSFITDKIDVIVYKSIKETDCGYWVKPAHIWMNMKMEVVDCSLFGKAKWVSKCSKKRLCYPTKKQAIESLKARNLRRIQILESQLSLCKKGMDIIENKLDEL